jgi:hypothetical protein
MRRRRRGGRRLTALLLALVIGVVPLSLTACNSKAFNAADCAFHLYRLHHDLKVGHHKLLDLYHIYEAAHHCPKAL